MSPLTPPQYWLTERSLTALRRLNATALELLHDEAKFAVPSKLAFKLREPARRALAQSRSAQRWAAARVPVLLCDLRFRDVTWWRGAIDPHFRPAGVPGLRRQPHIRRLVALHRAILHFGWHFAQHDRSGAEVLLGMHEGVITTISHCSPLDIERIADRTALDLRPRWLDRPSMWCQLLDNPLDEGLSRLAHIRSVQMLGALFGPATL